MKNNILKKRTVIILGGPTASGKSKLALKLAKEINGEIINGDSMQAYKNFPILTSQPNFNDQKEVKHHLYGYVETENNNNAMDWMKAAKKVINESHKKNITPILVGGSGLYLEFLYKGVNKIPSISKKIRNKVKKIFSDIPIKEIYDFALKIDHDYSSNVSKADIFRLTKLLEVYYQSNNNITYFRQYKRVPNKYNFLKVLYMPDKETVKKNIEARFFDMVKQGLVKEVENNIDKVKESNIEKAIGFMEIKDYIEGRIDFNHAKDLVIKKTKSFAKRQYTWFNNRYDADINIESNENISLIVESFLKIN